MSINISNINKSYNSHIIIKNLSLIVENNTVLLLSGKNGSGKTTLLKIISSIILPCSGTIFINKVQSTVLKKYLNHLAWIPTSNNGLIQRLNGYENIQFFSSLLKIKHNKNNLRLNKWIEIIPQFESILSTPFYKCSSGMKQLICLYCKTIHSPSFLILDEPFKNIDKENRITLMNILKNDCKNRTIIFSSHHRSEVKSFFSREVHLEGGKLVS